MIVGTGIDIVEVSRIADKIRDNIALRNKLFSKRECAFCDARPNRFEHYAARFAAKEAFLKATGLGLSASHDLFEIEIVTDELGKPSIVLRGEMKVLAEKNNWEHIHVTLSHIRETACAMVIIER